MSSEHKTGSKSSQVQLVIVTGMSGAGRTEAMRAFEDMGYFCVDNLPPRFILNLVDLMEMNGRQIRHVATACDVRSKEFFPELMQVIETIKEKEIPYKIVFLEAENDVLLKRYKRDRRKHPLTDTGEVAEGIARERETLQDLKGLADYIIDTSSLHTYQLKEKLKKIFLGPNKKRTLNISVTSFGFKYGVPMDSDLVLDVRFIPNPYYVEELRDLTGNDKPVEDYVLSREVTKKFLTKIHSLLDFLLPNYESEGKTHLMIAIGCTGGRHRSVVIAKEICNFLQERDLNVSVSFRDVDKKV